MSIDCNVCHTHMANPIFCSSGNTSLSSLGEVTVGKTYVYFCDHCNHLQTMEIVNIDDYYDKQYTILINSEDEDQIYKIDGKNKIYRYDFQAKKVAEKLKFKDQARILEYGAAKGATLKRIMSKRPDLLGSVFDVSDMYIPFWDNFISKERQATYTTPPHWNESFDYIVCFYVLEHVASLSEVMSNIWNLLNEDGTFYFIVPNTYDNIADFVVVDHVNHFSDESIRFLMSEHGFSDVQIDSQTHESAFIVSATKTNNRPQQSTAKLSMDLKHKALNIAEYWQHISNKIHNFEKANSGSYGAIYGAGFYGSFIFGQLDKPSQISCFVDQNPHLQGTKLFNLPVLAPEKIPTDINILYAGLNPKNARHIIGNVRQIADKKLNTLYL